jgi:hypothetical protein
MFLVIFFIYPLKFLFTWVVNMFSGVPNVMPAANGRLVPVIDGSQIPGLMTIYGLGFSAVFLVFLFLHLHAYRCRASIGLSAYEAYRCVTRVLVYAVGVSLALTSVAVASLGGPN